MEIKNINQRKIFREKKGEFLPRDIFFILVLFGIITGIGFLIVADMSSSDNGYNVPNMTDSNFQDNYADLTNVTSSISSMQNATASGEGLSTVSTFTTVFKATFTVISITFGSFGLIRTMFVNFTNDFGIPIAIGNILFGAIVTLLTAAIIFAIVSSVSRGKI